MWTRSAKNKQTGLLKVECRDWNGNLYFSGEFATLQEANEAGEAAERRMTLEMQSGLAKSELEMTDEEILAELGF